MQYLIALLIALAATACRTAKTNTENFAEVKITASESSSRDSLASYAFARFDTIYVEISRPDRIVHVKAVNAKIDSHSEAVSTETFSSADSLALSIDRESNVQPPPHPLPRWLLFLILCVAIFKIFILSPRRY